MRIIAGNIKNLTDARYFAAWQIEALVYTVGKKEMDHLSVFSEIKNWVEGPKTLLEFSGLNKMEVDQVMQQIESDGLIIHPSDSTLTSTGPSIFYKTKTIESPTPYQNIILDLKTDISSINKVLNAFSGQVYLVFDHYSINEAISLYAISDQIGFYVEGSMEEKVGYKSFEDLDQLMEAIENVNV